MADSSASSVYFSQEEGPGDSKADLENINLEEPNEEPKTEAETKPGEDEEARAKRKRLIFAVIGTTLALIAAGIIIGLATGDESGGDDTDETSGDANLQAAEDDCIADPGWFDAENGYQYRNTSEKLNWIESREECQRLGGDLAHIGIRNLTNRGAIITGLLGGPGTAVWLGISDVEEEGSFVFIDGVAANNSNTGWISNEPNDNNGNEDCVSINVSWYPENEANDLDCNIEHSALCEKILSCE